MFESLSVLMIAGSFHSITAEIGGGHIFTVIIRRFIEPAQCRELCQSCLFYMEFTKILGMGLQ